MEGQQIVPGHWVDEATRNQISNGNDANNDWTQGYGYQFWRCGHRAYRGDGAFGQYCVILPDQDAAIAITAGVMDMSGILNLVWEHLLPGISEGVNLQESYDLSTLDRKLNSLSL